MLSEELTRSIPQSNQVAPVLWHWGKQIWHGTHTAFLIIGLSLPQGLLALPIAVAEVGLVPGLLIVLAIGACNVVTVAWTAKHVARYFTQRGTVPSLARLADERLGNWGRLLTLGSSLILFFLALLASVVGLARNLEGLSHLPAPLWGAICGLALLVCALGKTTLNSRLMFRLGLLNLGLLVALISLMLRNTKPSDTIVAAGGSPLVMVGVSLMLFFAPMLVTPAAQQQLVRGVSPRVFVYGSAAGAAGSALLFALWAWAVWGVVGTAGLAGSAGTILTSLNIIIPEGHLLTILLGLLLLGMTGLRCALMLKTIVEEQLATQTAWRRLAPQLPAGMGLIIAIALLLADVVSFTQLIAIAGGAAASFTSLLIPTLLAHSPAARTDA